MTLSFTPRPYRCAIDSTSRCRLSEVSIRRSRSFAVPSSHSLRSRNAGEPMIRSIRSSGFPCGLGRRACWAPCGALSFSDQFLVWKWASGVNCGRVILGLSSPRECEREGQDWEKYLVPLRGKRNLDKNSATCFSVRVQSESITLGLPDSLYVLVDWQLSCYVNAPSICMIKSITRK